MEQTGLLKHSSMYQRCGLKPSLLQALEDTARQWDEKLAEYQSRQEEEEEEWIVPGEEEESVPWTARNSSELTPLINKEVMWLLKIAEDRMKNATGFHFSLKTARHLAMYTSVGYCLHENIRAWNCTRSVALLYPSKKGLLYFILASEDTL